MTIKIVGKASGSLVEVETNTLAARIAVRPPDAVQNFGGAYSMADEITITTSTTGNVYLGLFNVGPTLAFVRKFIASLGLITTSAVNNGSLALTVFRGLSSIQSANFTALSYPGTSGNSMRSAMRPSNMFVFYNSSTALTPSSSLTLDAQNVAEVFYSRPNTGGIKVLPPVEMLSPEDYPLVLEPGEGVCLQGTTLASVTGELGLSWQCSWEERDRL